MAAVDGEAADLAEEAVAGVALEDSEAADLAEAEDLVEAARAADGSEEAVSIVWKRNSANWSGG